MKKKDKGRKWRYLIMKEKKRTKSNFQDKRKNILLNLRAKLLEWQNEKRGAVKQWVVAEEKKRNVIGRTRHRKGKRVAFAKAVLYQLVTWAKNVQQDIVTNSSNSCSLFCNFGSSALTKYSLRTYRHSNFLIYPKRCLILIATYILKRGQSSSVKNSVYMS